MTWLSAAHGVASAAAPIAEASLSADTRSTESSWRERGTDPAHALETEAGLGESATEKSEWEPEPELNGSTKGERTRQRFEVERERAPRPRCGDRVASPRRSRAPPTSV